VLIADTDNHVIRRFDPIRGTIERVAGTGEAGAGPPGQAPLETALRFPHGVAVDAKGTLYIVDTGNHRLLRLEESPTP
jgi:sugar lactone lactonase YvrE